MSLLSRFSAAREERRKLRIAAATPRVAEGGTLVQYVGQEGKTDPFSGYSNQPTNRQTEGDRNTFRNYIAQVHELYEMLEGTAEYGGEPTRTVLGHRTSFLAGEGVRVSADTPELQQWITGWLKLNGLMGRMLTDTVQDAEVVGQSLWLIDDQGNAIPQPSFVGNGYDGTTAQSQFSTYPEWWPTYNGWTLTGIGRRIGMSHDYEPWLEVDRDRFVLVRTGGHGNVARYPAPTTRMCLMVDSFKNYDRAIREARPLNKNTLKQTPTFEIDKDSPEDDTTSLEYYRRRKEAGWDPGDPVFVRGRYKVTSSDSGPVDTLSREASMIVKSISATSSIPPHWIGWVDLMSNRSTADSLFESIKSGTLVERLAWEEGLDRMIRMARMVANGPTGDFSVTMPLLSYHAFKERNDSLLAMLGADVISHDDVRGQLPFQTQHEGSGRPMNENRGQAATDQP